MKKIIILFLSICSIHLSAQYVFTSFDIFPGTTGSLPYDLEEMNGKLYFFAAELSVSNGTPGGTHNVAHVMGQNLTAWNNKLYFQNLSDGELWRSDGTDTGTYLLKDIYSGANSSLPWEFTPMNGKLYFSATTFNGVELWVTDGTTAGTTMVKDIYPGVGSGTPAHFTALNNILYFNATDAANGAELWRSDGTSAGTYLVKDIVAGASSSDPFFLKTVGPKIYFRANNVSYVSDGTPAGTISLGMGINSNDFTAFNGMVYFSGGDGIYKTDGTPGGTSLLKSGFIPYDTAADFTVYNNELYFAIDGEPWKTDGTIGGTQILKDSICLTDESATRNFSLFNGKLFFVASDLSTMSNQELFVSDGTDAGTHMIMPGSINHINPLLDCYEFIPVFTGVSNALFFRAYYDDIGPELWKIGPGSIGIEKETIKDFSVYPNPTNGIVYFNAGENINDAVVTVYDLNGKNLINAVNLTSLQLNISDLSPGMYLIGVKKDHKESFVRIVKQ
jgi:ELWxxDGT repeat protein